MVFSLTYNCPIACKYCGVNCGPDRNERMSKDYIFSMIDEAAVLGSVKLIVFTGGEPFTLGEDLYDAVKYAASKGFLTRIVTNAFWASSIERAVAVLRRLKEIGLTEINFSCDDFHQEFIPLEYIKWANEAASIVKLPALIASKGLKESVITPSYLEKFFGKRLTMFRSGADNPDNDVISYSITVPVGRLSEQLLDDDLSWSKNPNAWAGPCDSVMESIVLMPNGDMSACCGIGFEGIPEMIIGNTFHNSLLELIANGNNDLIWNWLALEGPQGIMKFIQEAYPDIKFKERYVNRCHLCHELFSRQDVRSALNEKLDECAIRINFERAWLENHRKEKATKPEEGR